MLIIPIDSIKNIVVQEMINDGNFLLEHYNMLMTKHIRNCYFNYLKNKLKLQLCDPLIWKVVYYIPLPHYI